MSLEMERAIKRRRISGSGATLQFQQEEAPLQHHYGYTNVSGHATALQGDLYGNLTVNHFHSRPQASAKLGLLWDSLRFERMHARFREVSMPMLNTCTWLRFNDRFVNWLDDKKAKDHGGLLWIKGKPGCGKSTIMKELLTWATRTWNGQCIASYFFNARATIALENSCLGLYRSLVHQLLSYNPLLRQFFVKEFQLKERSGDVEPWKKAELQNLLLKMVSTNHVRNLCVFVDALDECETEDVRDLLAFLRELSARAVSNSNLFRICLSSRHYPAVSVGRGLVLVVEDQPLHTRDIELYVRKSLCGHESHSSRELRSEIIQRSAGIFMWVVLVVPMLNSLYDRGRGMTSMLAKLRTIPRDLNEMFLAMLGRTSEDIDECNSLLRFVMVTMRPLSPIELFMALQHRVAELNDEDLSRISHNIVSRYILDCSHGLVEATPEYSPTVHFIHGTVRDSLLGSTGTAVEGLRTTPLDFRFQICHSTAAELCVDYLLHVCSAEEIPSRLHLFLDYAINHWWRHMEAAKEMCSERLLGLTANLLTHDTDRLFALSSKCCRDSPWTFPKSEFGSMGVPHAIYIAACIDVPSLFREIIRGRININAKGGHFGSALQAAAAYGHLEIVEMLIIEGADVNIDGGRFGNALQIALERNQMQIAQILLQNGINVNSQGGRYGNALQAASAEGHAEMVHILLSKGANVNAQGGQHGNALLAALETERPELACTLLDKGADANSRGGTYGTTLLVATAKGYQKVVRKLLEAGAETDASGQFQDPISRLFVTGTALQAASACDFAGITQLLLQHNANTDNQEGFYGNALVAAAVNDHGQVVQMLLSAGANVAQSGSYWDLRSGELVEGDALEAASANGLEQIVKILLQKDDHTNNKLERYGRALQSAAVDGHHKIVQMLISNGADVNVRGGEYGNALMAAIVHCHEDVTYFLIDAGANVNSHGLYWDLYLGGLIQGSPLEAASATGQKQVVQKLLRNGADVNAHEPSYGSALQAASAYGHLSVVHLLLDAGANINAKGGFYHTAIKAAFTHEHKKVVTFLQAQGADFTNDEGMYGEKDSVEDEDESWVKQF